jgi:arylsulfatase A-like enzyme
MTGDVATPAPSPSAATDEVTRYPPRMQPPRTFAAAIASVATFLVGSSLGLSLGQEPAYTIEVGRAPDLPRPNIVLVMVDDLGWLDHSLPVAGASPPEERIFRTPHLERLAREGVVASQAYASAPVCSPTRVSLMTGQHPARHGVTYWTLHGGRDTSAEHPRLAPPPWRSDSLQPGDVTLAGLLRDGGYHTIHVGKAHYGAKGTPGEDPCALGFERNIAGHAAGGPGSFLGRESFSAAHRNGGRVWDVPSLAAYHGEDVYLTDVLAAEAARALEEGLAGDRPVYLQFAPYAVHAPITANPRTLPRVPEDLDPRERAYASMVASVDDALGLLLEVLDRTGARERTLVVYTSDNGGLSAHGRGGEPHTHNTPLASGKGSALEGGVRVPLVFSWPGVLVPRGSLVNPIVTHDLFATFLDAAHVRAPDGHAVDGVSCWPILVADATEEPGSRTLWWHMPHFWGVRGPGIEPFSSIVRDGWKLIHYHDGGEGDARSGRIALYDLRADPGEGHDVCADHPEEAEALARDLAALQGAAKVGLSWDKATGAQVVDVLGALRARR